MNGNTLYKQYKHHLSDFTDIVEKKKKEYKDRCFVFPENFGPRMGIDETGLFGGELYTILINKDKQGKKGSLAAIIKGTSASAVVPAIRKSVSVEKRMMILEMTMDMANSMQWITSEIAPNATKTFDRFHVERLVYDAMQDVRVRYRWEALEKEADADRVQVFENGDTNKQLLARSRYLLFKQSIYWTDSQAKRARILFREYPEIKKAYDYVISLKHVFSLPYNQARQYLEDWCKAVAKSAIRELVIAARTIANHATGIINFTLNKETNAATENFNAKIKDFFHRLRGVNDHDLFFYRLLKLYA